MFPKEKEKENIKECCNATTGLVIFLQIIASSVLDTPLTTYEI